MGESQSDSQTDHTAIMFVFLSLLSTALAAPQLHYGMYGYGYPSGYYPGFTSVYQPASHGYPVAGYPVAHYDPRILGYPTYPQVVGSPVQRDLTFGNFMQINGEFKAQDDSTLTRPVSTVTGNFNIQQNGIFDLFSDNDAKFSIYLNGPSSLNGKNIMVHIGTGATCANAFDSSASPAVTQVASGTAPPFTINGFYLKGKTNNHNIDGSNGKTTLKGTNKWLVITEGGTALANVIACSDAALQ